MDLRLFILFTLLGFIQSKVIDLSCDQIRLFVDGHNTRRLNLAKGEVEGQPAATEMKSVVWDEELAEKAAKWASTNQFSHNPDRTVPSGRFGTGENILWTASNNPNYEIDIDSAVGAWYSEHKDYTYGPLQASDFSSDKKQIGHYTQLAWSDSIYLGCGISEVWKDDFKNFYVVCNYGPTGNYLGRTPYKSGDQGSGTLACGAGDCSHPYGPICPAN